MHERSEWLVRCRDADGQRQEITVAPHEGAVVVTAPPGETAVLTPLEVGRLRAALRDAVLTSADTD